MIVTREPRAYVNRHDWVQTFGRVESLKIEDWGAVRSLRVRYAEGLEVEFGVTTPEWARTDPIDPGTSRVIAGGCRILFDREGLLRRLEAAAG